MLGRTLLIALAGLWAAGARAQLPPPLPAIAPPGAGKPAPASASNPKETAGGKGKQAKAAKVKLYPVSAQEAADAILADSLGRLFEQTDAHFHHGEYSHVVALNRVVAQGDPHNVEAYANSAWLLWSTDRNPEAIAFLQQGIKANPNTYYMYDELGSHYLVRMRDAASATPLFEQAVKFTCPYTTWHSLAHCYERTQQWDKAVDAWESASKYLNDPLALPRLARAKAERDKHKTP